MKKVLATMLFLCLLLSLAACAGKKERIYVVTAQKNYKNGEIVSTATFEYDDLGRPTAISFERADGTGRKSELTYDKAGNLISELDTYLYADNSENNSQQLDWNLTYTDDLLTRAEKIYGDETYVLKFSYNDKGQLTQVEYPQPAEGKGGDSWQTYAYNEDGRLTQETRCSYRGGGGNNYARVCYVYDAQGRLTEQYFCYAESDSPVDPESQDELDFKVSPLEHFYFYYDEEGKLAYIGESEEDAYPGGSAPIYSDEDYTFDTNGNLVRVQRGPNEWVEYTYEAIEMRKSDVVMHKRLIHGISKFMLSYTENNTMDPLFWAMCPPALYSSHLCSMQFYYLIPYPQFELFP